MASVPAQFNRVSGAKGVKHESQYCIRLESGLLVPAHLVTNSTGDPINPATHDAQTDGTQRSISLDGNAVPVVSYRGYTDSDLYEADVCRGAISEHMPFFAYGRITAPGAVTDQAIHPYAMGVSFAVPAIPGVQMTIASSSADDDSAGTGARSIHMHYLDGDLMLQVEEIVMDGLTPVLSQATDVRFVQCVHIHTHGSNRVAAGNISASNGGTIYSYVEAGKKRCSSSSRRVPAGHRLMIKSVFMGARSGSAAAGVTIRLATTKFDDVDYTEDAQAFPVMAVDLQDTSVAFPLDMPYPFEAGSVVAMVADSDKAAVISAGYFGYLEEVL